MAGSASSQLRSAYVAESTAGTIPSTPSFTTLHQRADMKATPAVIEHRSQVSQGARLGNGISEIDVTGEIAETPLVYGVYDDLLATLLQGAWSSDNLDDAKTVTTVSIENTIPAGDGGTNTMMRYRGVEAISGSINLASRSAATIALTLAGRGSDDATTTAITGATYTDPTEADPLSSGADVGTIAFSGYTLDCMQSLEIAFNLESRDPQPKISSDDLCGITRGDFLPVLTANMYLEDNFLAIYNAVRDRTNSSFSVTVPIGSVSGEKYTLVFPSCHFGSGDLDFSGANAMQEVQILPQYDTATDRVLRITRAVS
jgi:hypothetical protein